MEEIQAGEFVRTKDGEIGTFVRYSSRKDDSIYKSPFNCFIKFKNRKSILQCHRSYIAKHSFNLIDLIEVGDYVNGMEVKHIIIFEGFPDYPKLVFVDRRRLVPGETAENKDIKTIVTHEQFASLEYKVEEK